MGTFGKGEKVTVKDPYGFEVSFVYGQEVGDRLARPQKVVTSHIHVHVINKVVIGYVKLSGGYGRYGKET